MIIGPKFKKKLFRFIKKRYRCSYVEIEKRTLSMKEAARAVLNQAVMVEELLLCDCEIVREFANHVLKNGYDNLDL